MATDMTTDAKIDMRPTFQDLVKRGHKCMTEHAAFRATFPDKLRECSLIGNACSDSPACAYCQRLKKDYKFVKDDLKTTKKCTWCNYMLSAAINKINEVEQTSASFYGDYLTDLKELSKFVFVSHNNLDPDNSENNLTLSCFAPLSSAKKICERLEKISDDYLYLIFDEQKQHIIDHKLPKTGDPTFVYTVIRCIQIGMNSRDFPKMWREQMASVFDAKDPLVEIILEDKQTKRRDLYKVLLKLFTGIPGLKLME